MTYSEDDLLPISALQHFVFCRRRAALIVTEGLWADNQFTVEGTILHSRADDPFESETRQGVRIERSVGLVSLTHGLIGKADVIEFHPDATDDYWIEIVEYKRGVPKKRLDLPFQVQLCAQALCVEDMLGYPVAKTHIFYGKTRRRIEVPLDEKLRSETLQAIQQLHEQIDSKLTPKPDYKPNKCSRCSLFSLCMPQAVRPRATAARYVAALVDADGD